MSEQGRKALRLEQDEGVSIAYQGVPGAFSFEAASHHFKEKAHLLPYPSFIDVCNAVNTEHAKYGVLPLFNSQTGHIEEPEQLMMHYSFITTATVNYPITHCLLCLPGQKLSDIVIIISHPQALAQCSHFLARLPVQQTPTSNTAASAQMIQEKQLKGFAAIASASAARLYGLSILASSIQNTHNNMTRFSIFAKGATGRESNVVVSPLKGYYSIY